MSLKAAGEGLLVAAPSQEGVLSPESGPVTVRPDPFSNPFRPGQVIAGKYEVDQLLGRGAMGFVVSARHLELGERVALKFLTPEALTSSELVGRFAREARASARIKSEYVARVFDVGSMPNGAPFIVMEHLDGEDLAAVLQRHGALPMVQAIEYVMQACEALASAHALGIVHRDIKPENLFLVNQAQGIGAIKVLDFGVSKVALTGTVADTSVPLVQTMLPVGSPMYMSPEQIRGSENVDDRTDIWSLGCVLFELISGRAPFEAPSITQLTAAILENDPPPLDQLMLGVPPALEAIIARCLEKEPADRFQSVAELAVALYPFAPRRARLYAERCTSMLRVAVPSPELELQSRPYMNESVGRSSSSMARTRGRRTTTRSRAIVVEQPPVVEDAEVLEPLPSIPPRRSWVAIACVGLGILAIGAGAAMMLRAQAASRAQEAAAEAARPQVVAAPVAQHTAEALPVAAAAAEEAAPKPSEPKAVSAQPAPTAGIRPPTKPSAEGSSLSRAAARWSRSVRPAAARTGTGRTVPTPTPSGRGKSGDDEIDVGF